MDDRSKKEILEKLGDDGWVLLAQEHAAVALAEARKFILPIEEKQ